MRIRKIHIEKYKIFENFDIDFTHNNEPLDLIVIAGINGSGKSSLLTFINDFLTQDKYIGQNGNKIIGEIIDVETGNLVLSTFARDILFVGELFKPSPPPSPQDVIFYKTYQNNVSNAKEIIIKYIDKLIYEEDIKSSEAYHKVQKILNRILGEFDLQVEFNMLDKNRNLFFKSGGSQKINISDLSNGEQELITKAFTLHLSDITNHIILVDEPESSLHPNWQNRILKIYEDFAKENNNQIIIATHSPHIIASAKKESLRLLVKRGDKIEVVADFDGSYGYEVQRVLLEIMDLDSLRIPEINEKLEELKKFVFENKYKSQKFNDLRKELENILGRNDIDLSLLRLEIAKREKMNEKN